MLTCALGTQKHPSSPHRIPWLYRSHSEPSGISISTCTKKNQRKRHKGYKRSLLRCSKSHIIDGPNVIRSDVLAGNVPDWQGGYARVSYVPRLALYPVVWGLRKGRSGDGTRWWWCEVGAVLFEIGITGYGIEIHKNGILASLIHQEHP